MNLFAQAGRYLLRAAAPWIRPCRASRTATGCRHG